MKSENKIVVLGATGNIGGKVVRELLSKKAHVIAVGRDKARLQLFENKAELAVRDFHDDDFLKETFRQADALFCTVPDDALAAPEAAAQRMLALLQGSSITHVVNISNCTLKRNGSFTSLIRFEQELSKAENIHIKHLRCANFFENLNWGINTPYHPHLQLPYISSYEIAAVAADYLYHRNFKGITVDELLGERDYSMAELAQLVGVSYTQLPYTEENRSFYEPFNEGNFELVARTAANTSIPAQEKFTLQYFLQHDLKLPVQ